MNTSTQKRPPRQPRPRRKPERAIRLLVRPDEHGRCAVVRITEITHGKSGSKVTIADYTIDKIPADFGEGFLVQKLGLDNDASRYHILFQNQQDRTCECRGFLRYGKCRHIAGILALRAKGKL